MPSRESVYKLIDGERDYQEEQLKKLGWSTAHSVGNFLVLLNEYTQRANAAWCNNTGTGQALDFVRKIAGISVACMEQHETPARKQ